MFACAFYSWLSSAPDKDIYTVGEKNGPTLFQDMIWHMNIIDKIQTVTLIIILTCKNMNIYIEYKVTYKESEQLFQDKLKV